MSNICASCTCSGIILLSSNILPSSANLRYWGGKKIVIVGAWRSWHSLSQYCFQSWGCIQGMNFVVDCMSHTWFLSECFWHGPHVPDSDACFHEYIPWFMSHFHFCTHGCSFKYSAFLTDVLHFSSWGLILFLVVQIVFFPKAISEIL